MKYLKLTGLWLHALGAFYLCSYVCAVFEPPRPWYAFPTFVISMFYFICALIVAIICTALLVEVILKEKGRLS